MERHSPSLSRAGVQRVPASWAVAGGGGEPAYLPTSLRSWLPLPTKTFCPITHGPQSVSLTPPLNFHSYLCLIGVKERVCSEICVAVIFKSCLLLYKLTEQVWRLRSPWCWQLNLNVCYQLEQLYRHSTHTPPMFRGAKPILRHFWCTLALVLHFPSTGLCSINHNHST